MKLKKLTSAVAVSLMLASGAALAEPFYINVNNFDTSPAAGTDGVTADIYQLAVDFNATSTFTDDDGTAGLSVGDSVTDSGFGTVSNYLNSSGTAITGTENNEGVGGSHSLIFEYDDLAGTIAIIDTTANPDGILASYTSGTIHVYNDDNFDGDSTGEQEVLTLEVFSSAGTVGNAIIFATVSFADPGTWFFASDDADWSSLVVAINMRLDTNVDPTTDPVLIGQDGNGNDVYERTGTYNGSVEFSRVPEPDVLALLGIGLVGLGIGRRMKKST